MLQLENISNQLFKCHWNLSVWQISTSHLMIFIGEYQSRNSLLHWLLTVGGWVAPGNPMLWRGVPVAPIQKSFGSSGRDWKPGKKLLIPCKLCIHRFIRYSSTCYSKVRIDPLMANIRNPDFFASPVVNAAWLVVVLPCYLNRNLLSGPKGN